MRRSPLSRPLTAVVAALLAGGALAGCSGTALGGGCTPTYPSGDASSAISASGDVGSTPAVEFPTPLIADSVERSVTASGSGTPAVPGSAILYDFVYYVGETGASLTSGTSVLGIASDTKLAFGEALECATPGSRIVLTGPAGQIDAQYDGVDETLVAIIDVRQVFLGKANGFNQLPLDGMPTVATAVDGEPGITLTYQKAPDEARTAVIKAGGGATVKEGDTVVYHGRNWSWPAGTGGTPSIGGLDTWSSGVPSSIDVDLDVIGDEVVYDAFEGARVGSQILLVVPNSTGDGTATVVVLDILGILPE